MRVKVVFIACLLWMAIVPAASQETSVDRMLSQMSLREKVGQMFIVSFYGHPMNDAARDLLQRYQPGGVVLLPSNIGTPAEIARLTNEIQATVSIPAFIAVDQEGGLIAHLEDGFTEWAVPSLLTATGDNNLAREFGAALATELRAVGVNMNLAPVADLYTNPANTVIGRRSFGSDPQQVAPIVASVIEGMQSANVLATAKHFPGHGDTLADSHTELPVLSYSQKELEERELVPFQAAIDANVSAIMMSHIYLSDLEPTPDIPASLSRAVTTELLRDSMIYDGLIMTDALDMDAIDTRYSVEDAVEAAIQAGNDLVLVGAHVSPTNHAYAIEHIVSAVREGRISEQHIDASVRRILAAKQRYQILSMAPINLQHAADSIPLDTHLQLVEQIFRKGITQAYGELPQTDDVLFVYPATRFSLWRECNRQDWRGLGISDYPTESDIATVLQSAVSVDAVIVVTQNVRANPTMQTLVEQLPLEKTTVVALWSPFDARYLPQTQGYIMTYSPLPAAYAPLCDILHGEQSATGRVTFSLDIQKTN